VADPAAEEAAVGDGRRYDAFDSEVNAIQPKQSARVAGLAVASEFSLFKPKQLFKFMQSIPVIRIFLI
jgi:hypothetical protein